MTDDSGLSAKDLTGLEEFKQSLYYKGTEKLMGPVAVDMVIDAGNDMHRGSYLEAARLEAGAIVGGFVHISQEVAKGVSETGAVLMQVTGTETPLATPRDAPSPDKAICRK